MTIPATPDAAPHPKPAPQPEPWLRGTHTELPAVLRAVLHAFELAQEDVHKWTADLTEEELNASPLGLTPISFHMRHIPGTLDRLLTYAEGHQLSADQLAALRAESAHGAAREELFAALTGVSRARPSACAPLPNQARTNPAPWDASSFQPQSADCWCISPTTPSATQARSSPPPSCLKPSDNRASTSASTG